MGAFALRNATRRSRHRETVHWPARWRAPSGNLIIGEILDISGAGLFLGGDLSAAKVGTRISVLFATPGQRTKIATCGTVRWTGMSRTHECTGFGIEFDQINPSIDSYVRRSDVVISLQ